MRDNYRNIKKNNNKISNYMRDRVWLKNKLFPLEVAENIYKNNKIKYTIIGNNIEDNIPLCLLKFFEQTYLVNLLLANNCNSLNRIDFNKIEDADKVVKELNAKYFLGEIR